MLSSWEPLCINTRPLITIAASLATSFIESQAQLGGEKGQVTNLDRLSPKNLRPIASEIQLHNGDFLHYPILVSPFVIVMT